MSTAESQASADTACIRCDKDHARGSAECPARRVGGVVDGRYRLDHLIGSGGCGAVYAATHLRLGSRVAVKMLLPRLSRDQGLVARFLREARSAAALSHEGIVRVTDFGSAEDGAPYFVMEHLAAANLGALVRKHGLLAPAEVAAITTKILEALGAAHRAGIVHRDIKPENILYLRTPTQGAQIKIVDFGLAKVTESSDPDLTETGRFFGTLNYASPEQLANSKAVDVRSDIYSLGAVLFFLLTGRNHVAPGSVPEIISRVLQGDVERRPARLRPETPDWLDALVARALAQDPKARFAHADEMLTEISRQALEERESDLVSLTLSLSPGDSIPSAPRPFVRHPAVVVAALALVTGAWLAWSRWAGDPRTISTANSPPPGPGMVPVAGGSFLMGSSEDEIAEAFAWCRRLTPAGCDLHLYEREAPRRQPFVSSFAIDATEVTNRQFADWLQRIPRLDIEGDRLVRLGDALLTDLHPAHSGLRLEGGRIRPREGHEEKPVVQVTWTAARRYCEAQGTRLPTEAEWERAARGRSARRFPWGDDAPTCATSVFGRGPDGPCGAAGAGARDVGTTEADRSEEGVFDLGGNVSEWVEDTFRPRLPDCPPPCRDPVTRGPEREKTCRGGNWGALAEMCRGAGRGRRAGDDVSHQIGFRCATSR
jgi:serine/threonine protein kinase